MGIISRFGKRGSVTDLTDQIQTTRSNFHSNNDVGQKVEGGAVQEPPAHIQVSDEEAARRLKLYRAAMANDPNLALDNLEAIDDAVGGHDVAKENRLLGELVEDSPYPEV